MRRALELPPGNPDAHAARGQPAAALPEFERAVAGRPDADDVPLDFAGMLEQRRAEARRAYERLAGTRDTPGGHPKSRARAAALTRALRRVVHGMTKSRVPRVAWNRVHQNIETSEV